MPEQFLGLLGEVAREPQRLGDAPAVVGHDAGGRVDRDGEDLVRRVVGDLLDVHAALGRDHDGDAAGLAVDKRRKVELGGDVGALLDVEAVDLLAGRAGLEGDERAAEHLPRKVLTSSSERARRTPPLAAGLRLPEAPLPRPPAWIWALTTQTGPGSSRAAASTSPSE